MDIDKSHWFTGGIIRMCHCGSDRVPPSPCLNIYTDGFREYAHCAECGKVWSVDTLKEIRRDEKA